MAALSFEERFGLLVDDQMTDLVPRRMRSRLKSAKHRLSASIEDPDLRQGCGLDGAVISYFGRNRPPFRR